jgi:lysophospholipase L1-like esterase
MRLWAVSFYWLTYFQINQLMRRNIIYKLIAVSIPFVFIIILEIILRLANYGEDYQLFRRIPMKDKADYLVMNKDMAKKYFKDNELKSDNQLDLFLKEKTDSTFRVFVQGASTVVGFPFYRGGSFPRMLKHRLSLTFPDMNIEVVNTGMTAVNSYTLLDLVDEIIEQKPDLVIIYAGHNEYYGAMGTGSSISYGSHPIAIRSYLMLKELRFFQLCENGFQKMLGSNIPKPSQRTTTLMEVMADKQRIPYQSEAYFNGINQFEANLKKILSKYNKKEIPVILSTVVSNERDVQPFISEGITDIEPLEEVLALESPDTIEVAQYDAHEVYKRGILYLKNDEEAAKKYLHLAKELDLLRFRAPQEINDVIVKLSQEYNASLVDMKAIFETHSPNGIVGNKLLTEHVHPTIEGQFLMADAFYEKIKELNVLDNWENYIPYHDAVEDIPVSLIDSLQGKIVIEKLKNSWPYTLNPVIQDTGSIAKKSYIDRLTEIRMAQDINLKVRKWDDVMAIAYNTYDRDKDYEKGLQVAQSLIFEYPEQGVVYRMAGDMCLKMKDYPKAVFYYTRYNYFDESSDSAEKLALAYLELNKIPLARKTLRDARNKGLEVIDLTELPVSPNQSQ